MRPALGVLIVEVPKAGSIFSSVARTIECIPSHLGKEITAELHVPVIGIGAGPDTAGKILVLYDVLDISPGRKPRFVQNFQQGRDSPLAAIRAYGDAVKSRAAACASSQLPTLRRRSLTSTRWFATLAIRSRSAAAE
mgnify:CR=1 FL=1